MLGPSQILRLFESFIRPIKQRIMTLVARGVLESLKDTGQGIQLVKVNLLAGETRDDLERVQNFGVTSNPPPLSEVVALFVGGNREHGFILDAAPRDLVGRPSVLPGEVAMYSLTPGHRIKLHLGGFISIENATVDLVKSYDRLLGILAAEPFIVAKTAILAEKVLIATMKVP